MRRFHAALRPGVRMDVLEMIPNEDRISPPDPGSFSLMMLANTPSGDAFTLSEYQEMLDAAGLRRQRTYGRSAISPALTRGDSLVVQTHLWRFLSAPAK
ncbi:MAG: hypothetical protein K2X03_14775 [Bryobacteraceae bacterium]|nr:hypothetical protein [Bryobacteraceae bacterium]